MGVISSRRRPRKQTRTPTRLGLRLHHPRRRPREQTRPPTKLGLRLDDNVGHTCVHDNVDINVNLRTNVFFFTREKEG